MTESNRIEYKQQLTDSLEKEVVAFLNYHDGGIIYLGVNDDGSASGLSNVDAVQLAIKDRLKNNIQPSALGLFDVIHQTRDNKELIKIIVASGSEKPYHLRKYGMSEKGCFIRIGSACEPMPARMIEELFSKRTRNSLSRIRSIRQDLSFEQLSIYYQEVGLTLNDKFAANLELLTEEGVYNYTAYLLADQNGNSVQVAKYAGTDRVELAESKDYGFCCLIKTCKLVLDRLEAVENRVINQITPRERINRPYWNPVALREAVINAIIHNDYATELVPKFELFTDRLEITSAASIHPGEEQENFFAGYSIPRNKALMRVFKDLELVEYLGSGMPRILKAYPRESYTFSSHFIRTSFPISAEALALEEVVKLEVTKKGGATGGAIGGAIELTQRQKEILSIIQNNPAMSYRAMADKLAINQSAVSKHLNTLKKKGVLKRIGGTRGYWEVITEEKQ
ncbi:MAG TPA: winged helix-turn-helix transcriptional regulator [Desulfobacterales bacterium]|nr:MAG: transcriptional regulator [Deltaproteobacteria bacterium]HHC25276.1 winged helix-turn-helix transcriptional regulator [Desulfobacterales bacterium]